MTNTQRKQFKKDEVLKHLRKGWDIYATLHKVYGSTFNVVYQSRKYWIESNKGKRYKIHHATIRSLQANNIIDEKYNLVAI